MPYLRGMILKELIQKYEFDAIVPDLLADSIPKSLRILDGTLVAFHPVCLE